eukprot:scaffold1.g5305.t1
MEWLPAARVWARVPAASESGEQPRKRRRVSGAPVAPPPPASPTAAPEHDVTGFALAAKEAGLSGDSDIEEYETPPTCPICLTDVVHLEERALLSPCMHAYCHACIKRWLEQQRTCPLCKGRVASLIHSIRPDQSHTEEELAPTPKAAACAPGEDAEGLLNRWHAFFGAAQRYDEGHRREPLQPVYARAQTRVQHLGGARGSGRQDRPPLPRQPAPGQPGPQGPRPYFWRVQQMLAGSHRGEQEPLAAAVAEAVLAGEGGSLAELAEEQYVLLWRRQVYEQNLWAVPPPGAARPAPGSLRLVLGSGSARERRVVEWVERELRGLTRENDVTLLRGLVMGLLATHGPRGDGGGGLSPAAAAAGGAQAGVPAGPVAALRPFLFDRAALFWHELGVFAASPLSIRAYDRQVTYRRQELAARPAPASGASEGRGGRPSRWDQRQTGHPGQPQQREVRPAEVVFRAPARPLAPAGAPAEVHAASEGHKPRTDEEHRTQRSGRRQSRSPQRSCPGASRNRSGGRRRSPRRSSGRNSGGHGGLERRRHRAKSRSATPERRRHRSGRRTSSPGDCYLEGEWDGGDRWEMGQAT